MLTTVPSLVLVQDNDPLSWQHRSLDGAWLFRVIVPVSVRGMFYDPPARISKLNPWQHNVKSREFSISNFLTFDAHLCFVNTALGSRYRVLFKTLLPFFGVKLVEFKRPSTLITHQKHLKAVNLCFKIKKSQIIFAWFVPLAFVTKIEASSLSRHATCFVRLMTF